MYQGNIRILHMIEGAKQARGLTVIIDVFRAFSLECYLTAMGAASIRPAGTVEEAFAWRERDPECLLIGERGGKMCEGFDFGNSPCSVSPETVGGKKIIHTTSAGTQGIVNATGAEELITGSLVNAKAIADYILRKNPAEVSLVCMGNAGIRPAAEDELCAEYIRSLLLEQPLPDISERAAALQQHGGEHFFDPNRQEIYPEADFFLCIRVNAFDFVLRVERDGEGYRSVPVFPPQ